MSTRTTTMPGIVQRLAALLLLLALLVLLALGGRLWLGQRQFYQAHIEQLQDRLLRLQRMAALKPQLEQVIADLRADQSNAAQFLPGNAPPLAAAELQQRVKRTVEAAGGELLSAQVLPVVEEGGVLRISIGVGVQCGVSALQGILYTLETQQPLLFIDNLELSARLFRPRLPNNEIANYTRVQLNAQFEVSGYLPREGG